MVHSIELLLDSDTEVAIRSVWQTLSDKGLRSPAPTSRPHVTMVVADAISVDVDEQLRSIAHGLAIPCVVGAPMVFGRSPFVLVRVVVPSTELLALQADVVRVSAPYLTPDAAVNTAVGQWTPHITLARRVEPSQLSRALGIRKVTRDIRGRIVGVRRWDGNKRTEYVIT